jgi:methylmalonyl-CoA/ethylmalonyl-CoA epimerase
MKFHHIGIFVKSLDFGRSQIPSFIPIKNFTDPIIDKNLHVEIMFANDTSGLQYELIAPFGDKNPVSSILASEKAIINHVAYTTTRFNEEIDRFRKLGAIPLTKAMPAKVFQDKKVIFFLTPMRFIIELIEFHE